jgi:hypothetical protein
MTDLIALDSSVRHPDHQILDRNDWRPGGAFARQLVRRRGLPLPTAIVVLESAGVPVEGDR